MTDGKRPISIPSLRGRDGLERPQPKRFYAGVGSAPRGSGFAILLDTRTARTPKKRELLAPNRALAEALAAEWRAQVDTIDPATMPLTRLANTALDGVTGHEPDVRADIVKYSGSDLVCYRAEAPPGLVALQRQHWDTVLAWARQHLGASFAMATGVVHVAQPAAATGRVAAEIAGCDAWRLAALHVMTTLTGSALIALAHAGGHLTLAAAWAAAHVDEDWQISQWGGDAEAVTRREKRNAEMVAASRLLQLMES